MSFSKDTQIQNASEFRDKRRYFWLTQPFLPLLPTLSCFLAIEFGSGIFHWLTVIFWFGLVALLDELLPKDSNNPPIDIHLDLEGDSYYGKVIFFAIEKISSKNNIARKRDLNEESISAVDSFNFI